MLKILIGEGDPVRFDEIPDSLDFETQGVVTWIDEPSNTVIVDVPGWGEVQFDLDGSSWDGHGRFKRDIAFVSWE